MAAIKASMNLFELLDGNDPGDKRLVDFDSQIKDQPKKPSAAATSGYKPKKDQASKKPASAAASTKNKPKSSGFKSEKSSPALAAGYKAPRKNLTTPAVAATVPSMAMALNKAAPPVPPPTPSTILAGVLFAFPSARDRIFKQRQEEYERHQAKARQEQEEYERQQAKEKGGSDDGKSAAAAAPPADKKKKNGKTHGVRVQQGGGGNYNGAKKQQLDATVKELPTPQRLSEKPAAAAVVQTLPPSMDDIHHFPSLK